MIFSCILLVVTDVKPLHLDDINALATRFPCSVCNKSYLRKRHLQRHMRDECIGIPPRFHCEYCPSKFRRKYHLVRHLSSKHGIPKIFNSSITLTQINNSMMAASPSTEGIRTPNSAHIKSDTDYENIESNIIPPLTNADRFSVEALMMKQEPQEPAAPLDFSYPHFVDEDVNAQTTDTLQRTFQNLKYLFVNYAMNNVPNFSS